jgi:hypothetical protein
MCEIRYASIFLQRNVLKISSRNIPEIKLTLK